MMARYRLAVLFAAVLWGTTGTVAHFAPPGASPFVIGLSTFGVGGLVLAAVQWRSLAATFRTPGATRWLLWGGLGAIAYPTAYYESMSLAGVAVGNIVALGSGPIFAGILEWIIERRRVTSRWAIATGIAIAGLAVILVSETGGGSPASNPPLGIALALVAGFGYALYAVAAAQLIARGAPAGGAMAGVFLAGSVVMVPALLIIGPGPLLEGTGPIILAYLALIPFALAYLLFGFALRGMSASSATLLALAEPIAATALAVAIVGERPPPLTWVGLAVLAAAIVVLSLPAARRGRTTAS